MKNRPLLIIGAGGHVKNLLEALQMNDEQIAGITDVRPDCHGQTLLGVLVIGDDDIVFTYLPQDIFLVNGVGSVGDPRQRRQIFERFKERCYSFYNTIHPKAYVSPSAVCKRGGKLWLEQ